MQFSNPRKLAEFNDWPSGQHRVLCKFVVESKVNKGERVSRTTTDKNGNWCKPKTNTYATLMVIVDGDDGRTYILSFNKDYGSIRVEQSDFKSMPGDSYFSADKPEFEELAKLFLATLDDQDNLHRMLVRFVEYGRQLMAKAQAS